MFFDLQQGKSILKKRQKKNNIYEGFINNDNGLANANANNGGDELDNDLNIKNKSNSDNDSQLVAE